MTAVTAPSSGTLAAGRSSDFVGRFVEGEDSLYRKRHQALFRYWSGLRPAPDRLPSRGDIDPIAIPSLLSSLWMTNVVWLPGGLAFRERLVGTGTVHLHGFDTTGRWLEDIYAGRHLERQLATYRAIALAGRPHLSRLCMPEAEGPFLVFDRLILPLAGDGVRTDILLGIHAWEPEAGEEPAGWPPSDATVERAGDPLPGGWRVPEPA